MPQGCLSYDVQVVLKIEKTGERIKRDMAASFVWRRLPTKKNAQKYDFISIVAVCSPISMQRDINYIGVLYYIYVKEDIKRG